MRDHTRSICRRVRPCVCVFMCIRQQRSSSALFSFHLSHTKEARGGMREWRAGRGGKQWKTKTSKYMSGDELFKIQTITSHVKMKRYTLHVTICVWNCYMHTKYFSYGKKNTHFVYAYTKMITKELKLWQRNTDIKKRVEIAWQAVRKIILLIRSIA